MTLLPQVRSQLHDAAGRRARSRSAAFRCLAVALSVADGTGPR